jgi:hypothetical protein
MAIVPAHQVGRATVLAPDGDHLALPVGVAYPAARDCDAITDVCFPGSLPTSRLLRSILVRRARGAKSKTPPAGSEPGQGRSKYAAHPTSGVRAGLYHLLVVERFA